MMTLSDLKDLYVRSEERKKMLEEQARDLEGKIEALGLADVEQASVVLQKLSELQRNRAKEKLQSLCTYALQYAISPDYEMEIEMGKSRGVPSAEMFIVKKGSNTRTSPLEGNGGGIVDIISLALRYVVMQIHHPPVDGPIIMDEPCKMVSAEYIPMISEFMKKLSADFDRQIILCTHNEYLANVSEKKIHVSIQDGESIIKEV